jgi:hypothetical protein
MAKHLVFPLVFDCKNVNLWFGGFVLVHLHAMFASVLNSVADSAHIHGEFLFVCRSMSPRHSPKPVTIRGLPE